MKQTPEQELIVKLKREVMELNAQLSSAHHWADLGIDKCGMDSLLGSGVILRLSFLGGKDAFEPVCIRDGLSGETIESIKKDLRRSYNQSIEWKPRGLTDENT